MGSWVGSWSGDVRMGRPRAVFVRVELCFLLHFRIQLLVSILHAVGSALSVPAELVAIPGWPCPLEPGTVRDRLGNLPASPQPLGKDAEDAGPEKAPASFSACNRRIAKRQIRRAPKAFFDMPRLHCKKTIHRRAAETLSFLPSEAAAAWSTPSRCRVDMRVWKKTSMSYNSHL